MARGRGATNRLGLGEEGGRGGGAWVVFFVVARLVLRLVVVVYLLLCPRWSLLRLFSFVLLGFSLTCFFLVFPRFLTLSDGSGVAFLSGRRLWHGLHLWHRYTSFFACDRHE